VFHEFVLGVLKSVDTFGLAGVVDLVCVRTPVVDQRRVQVVNPCELDFQNHVDVAEDRRRLGVESDTQGKFLLDHPVDGKRRVSILGYGQSKMGNLSRTPQVPSESFLFQRMGPFDNSIL
jgi:hypothetical protein